MLRLALPSKGEMEEPTLRFLAACGLRVDRPNPRQYTASIAGLPEMTVLFQRAADIADKVDEGSADLGIAGLDTVCEARREGDAVEVVLEDLGYSRCELVVAVPDAWLDVSSVGDLADLSLEFRERGRELRVATKYPRLVQDFLLRKGIHHFGLVEARGAMEAAPTMGYADIIADLTSSGTTLRENRLKLIAGGTILRSQACLVGNRTLLRSDPAKLALTRDLLELMEAQLRARGYYLLTANVCGDSPEAVAERVLQRPEVAGLQGPTVAPVFSKTSAGGRWYAVTIVVGMNMLPRAVEHLREIGCSAITVSPVKYVFEAESSAYARLRDTLKTL